MGLPAGHFATLPEFRVETAGERAVVSRTSLFAEARVEIDGEPFMLCLPVRPESVSVVGAASYLLHRPHGSGAVGFRILADEYSFVDEWGHLRRCDIILHPLPEGRTLEDAVTAVSRSTLLRALRVLHGEFVRWGVRHRNLKPSNIVFGDDGTMYAIRCYYLINENDRTAIDAEFAAVEEYIITHSVDDSEPLNSVQAAALEEEFDEIFPPCDMMQMVRRGDLYGFVDAEGRVVLDPQFTYAELFCENRAVVECGRGHQGVIDRCGNYIVPPQFDMVWWTSAGNFGVRRGNSVGEFDYTGEVITQLAISN